MVTALKYRRSPMASSSQKTVVILIAVLVAVVLVAGLVIWLLPPSSTPDASPSREAGEFNTSILQRPDYLRLDQQPVREGAVPVAPPAGVGKANPFL